MLRKIFYLLCLGGFFVSFLLGLVSWFTPAVGPEAAFRWTMRIAMPLIAMSTFAFVIMTLIQSERAPDFLWKLDTQKFGSAVIFAFQLVDRDGICWLEICYQNRFVNAAKVRVLVQPSQNFVMRRNDLPAIMARFPCGQAAYGVVAIPIAIPSELQGSKQRFDVAASIDYPQGVVGEVVRNSVGTKLSSFDNPAAEDWDGDVLQVDSGFAAVPFTSPSRVDLPLPTNVQESAIGLPPAEHREEWTLADLQLEDSANAS